MGFGSGGVGSLHWGSGVTAGASSGATTFTFAAETVGSGPIEGGTPFIIKGKGLDMAACNPDFSDGALDAGFWTDTSAGTGSAVENADISALVLDTGGTAAATASLRTAAQMTSVDVSVVGRAVNVLTPNNTTVELLRLGFIRGTSYVRLSAERIGRGEPTIRATVVINGGTTYNQVVATASPTAGLRLLRHKSRVLGFVGGTLALDTWWTSDAASIEVATTNDVTRDSRVTTQLTSFVRRPVIAFDGSEPARDVEVVNPFFVKGSSPAHTLPGRVDVSVWSCGQSVCIVNGWEYIPTPGIVTFNQGRTLQTIAPSSFLPQDADVCDFTQEVE